MKATGYPGSACVPPAFKQRAAGRMPALPGRQQMTIYARSAGPTGRTKNGQALLEVVSLLVVLSVLFLMLVDGCIFVWALGLSNEACATACRAASMGPPEAFQCGAPKRNAESALANLAARHGLVRVMPTCQVSESIRKPLPVRAFGGVVDGDVSVVTTVTAFLPFTCNVLRCGPISMSRAQKYAYSWALTPHVTSPNKV